MTSVQPEPVNTPVRAAQTLLQRLEWTVLRRLDGLLQGDYRTLLRGTGLDLADLREYQHHDDVRHMDWNVTARLQQPYVRVFTEDREMAAWFVLDLSASMGFGSDRQTKAQVAMDFTAVLSRVLTRHGNRVGALLFGQAGKPGLAKAVVQPGSSRRHILSLLHVLQQSIEEIQARIGYLASKNMPPATRLSDWLTTAGSLIRRRSTVFVLSDFISAPGWEKPLGQLALRHEVVAVRLFDPMEHALPDLGLLTFSDAETGEQLLLDTHDARFRQRFTQLAEAREHSLRNAFGKAGVDVLELSTEDDLVEALVRFTALRKRQVTRSHGRGNPQLPAHLQKAA